VNERRGTREAPAHPHRLLANGISPEERTADSQSPTETAFQRTERPTFPKVTPRDRRNSMGTHEARPSTVDCRTPENGLDAGRAPAIWVDPLKIYDCKQGLTPEKINCNSKGNPRYP